VAPLSFPRTENPLYFNGVVFFSHSKGCTSPADRSLFWKWTSGQSPSFFSAFSALTPSASCCTQLPRNRRLVEIPSPPPFLDAFSSSNVWFSSSTSPVRRVYPPLDGEDFSVLSGDAARRQTRSSPRENFSLPTRSNWEGAFPVVPSPSLSTSSVLACLQFLLSWRRSMAAYLGTAPLFLFLLSQNILIETEQLSSSFFPRSLVPGIVVPLFLVR